MERVGPDPSDADDAHIHSPRRARGRAGAAPALTDLLGGQVTVMVDNLVTALPHVNADRLRALAVTTGQRAAELPAVPTVAGSGYPGFEGVVWVGLLTSSKVSAPIVEHALESR